ncbi:MAG: class II fumarate hydratase [Bryobacteraceae bacterium]|nr:class II fumarate hydratase [Bryobacteraceae bacterium]
MDYRIEHDSMGEMKVPAGAWYGPQTARAVENFPISGHRLQRPFLEALGRIKAAAARFHGLPRVEQAALRVAAGELDSEFPVDVFQTGSGTSTNMNANEVIARLSGAHPNDDVNRGQSSNDVIPSALHISAAVIVHRDLLPATRSLAAALAGKAAEFHGVIKIGRTHLQDAVPIRLGQEFSGYSRQVRASAERVESALDGIYELALGGTAVGTGLNAPPGFAAAVIADIARETGLPFREADNHFEAQAARDAAAFLSAALRNYALALTKIANDIRWLGSGPRCGIGELRLPAVQPGSSIMPGKVNPVIAESVLMICAQVVGHDAAIAWCAAAGNFELNAMLPLIAWNLLDSIDLLAAGTRNFELKLVQGLEADRARAEAFVEQSLAMVTALAPVLGYDRAAEIAKQAYSSGRSVREVARELSGLDAAEIDRLLNPESQV